MCRCHEMWSSVDASWCFTGPGLGGSFMAVLFILSEEQLKESASLCDWTKFVFCAHLIGERRNQSHSKDRIIRKWLNTVLWRYFLCLQVLYPEISLHFVMALIRSKTLNNLLTEQIYSITLSKSPVNMYGNNFHLCAKPNITGLLIHFCRHVCELCICWGCIQIASKAMPTLRRWNETLKFNFFSPFWEWGSLEKPWFVDLAPALEQ